MPDSAAGPAQAPGAEPLNLRLVQVWVIAGMAGALILSIAALAMRIVMSQTRQLVETPRVKMRIVPPITVLLNDDRGQPAEEYTVEVDLQVFSDSRDIVIGPPMENLRLSIAELIKNLTDQAFRYASGKGRGDGV